jgi:peptidoglycan/xylan/chitin deacetylase (PgdA/CDA1 family)
MYLIKTPGFVQGLFPNFTWKIPSNEREVFLTFDDGPVPSTTPWILDLLDSFNAKATFFCVGENVARNPDLFAEIKRRGHMVGNHTYNHLAGWSTDNIDYYHNIRKCAQLVDSPLFRPPYGKMKPSQIQFLQRHYQIVMWDVLSGDFDEEMTPERCYSNVVRNVTEGSIVVMHDNIKSFDVLQEALPAILQDLQAQGYTFKALSPSYATEAKTSRVFAKAAV